MNNKSVSGGSSNNNKNNNNDIGQTKLLICPLLDPLTPLSDQTRISPNIINTISNR